MNTRDDSSLVSDDAFETGVREGTLGAEEELWLADPETLKLADGAQKILAARARGPVLGGAHRLRDRVEYRRPRRALGGRRRPRLPQARPARASRAARQGPRHQRDAPHRRLAGAGDHRQAPLPAPEEEAGVVDPAQQHVLGARPLRRKRPRQSRLPLQPPARVRAAHARALGQLSVLAGGVHGHALGPHPDVLARLPPRRAPRAR